MAAASEKHQVVVIGGGLAGLAAALEAAQSPFTHVILLDKEARTGGNSAKATSGINGTGVDPSSSFLMRAPHFTCLAASGTAAQLEQKVEDTVNIFSQDTHESGHGLCDPALVSMLTSQSADAVAFLTSHGEPPRQTRTMG